MVFSIVLHHCFALPNPNRNVQQINLYTVGFEAMSVSEYEDGYLLGCSTM
jgi:hypothetical protein